jgi:hypothetical protein|tara:strand:- start:53 stop:727 length:675 start_codon:yes stop_codon:yes gene_type:complete
MTIDKRINFQGGGMDMGNESNQAQSASMGNSSSNTSSNNNNNNGGGGGGQDQKPVTGDDYRRSQNEFINNFNQNEASRFEPTFFNRNYNPITLDQFGSSNQPPNYGNAVMGGILGLINPLAGLAYRGYNYLQDNVPQTLNTFKQSPTLMDFYNNMRTAPVNDTIDIREKFNRTDNGLTGIESIQTVGSDSLDTNNGLQGMTIQEIQELINNANSSNLSNTQGSM